MRSEREPPSPTWHIDEVFLRRNGRQYYQWRAVDDEGEVHDVLSQSRRNTDAARKFLRHAMKQTAISPETIVTDKWSPSMSAVKERFRSISHQVGKRLNNRAENSHQPTRRHERKLQKLKSPASAQRFLSTHAAFYNHVNIQRHPLSRKIMKQFRADTLCACAQLVSA